MALNLACALHISPEQPILKKGPSLLLNENCRCQPFVRNCELVVLKFFGSILLDQIQESHCSGCRGHVLVMRKASTGLATGQGSG